MKFFKIKSLNTNFKEIKISKSDKTSIIIQLTLKTLIPFDKPLNKSCFPLGTNLKFSQI